MRMTCADFARRKGVNRSTVTRWVERGRMALTPDGLVDVEVAEKSLSLTASPYAHHEARAAQVGGVPVAGSTTPDNTPVAHVAPLSQPASGQGALPLESSAGDDAALRLKVARANREEEEARLARMKREAEAKLLLPRAAVEFVMADLGRTTAALLERMADRYTSSLVAAGSDPAKVHAVLAEAAHDVRTELAAHAKRKAAEVME